MLDTSSNNKSIDINEIINLYNRNYFLDAYEKTRFIFDNPKESINFLSVKNLILLGRLAGRLGSDEILKLFYDKAIETDPKNSLVRYYAKRIRKSNLIEDITDFEKDPDPKFFIPEFKVSWYGSSACLYSLIRDFETAGKLIKKAKSFDFNKSWTSVCSAEVLFSMDRWDEALKEAEFAFQRSPGMPGAASVLSKIMLKMGKIDELSDKLLSIIDEVQSYEYILIAIWCLCVKAERSDDKTRLEIGKKAYDLSNKIKTLTPLADNNLNSVIESAKMDIAMVMGDYDLMENHGKETDSYFYKKITESIKNNPDGKKIILPFAPVFQKHNTCLPSSAASVLSSFKINVDEDEIARELTYNGTPIWKIEEWLNKKNIHTKPFILNAEIAKDLIKNSIPFINIIEYANGSHATAVVGFDEKTNTFIIHDPSSERIIHALMDRFFENEEPFGPTALAMVPQDKKDILEIIPKELSLPAQAYNRYSKYIDLNKHDKAVKQLRGYRERFADTIFSKRFKAIEKSLKGFLYEAIEIQKELLTDYPKSIFIQRELIFNLYKTRNKKLIKKILKNIVERGKLPGAKKGQLWEYPATTYIAQYADFIGDNEKGFNKAKKSLLKAIEEDPLSPETYHILGDIYIRESDIKSSLIPHKIASFLDDYSEHYARQTCNSYRMAGDEKQGLNFLYKRVKRLKNSPMGSLSVITYIQALEDFGYPEKAAEVTRSFEKEFDYDAYFSAFCVSFWIRIGDFKKSEIALKRVKDSKEKTLFLSSASTYYLNRGLWQKGLEVCKSWVKELPNDIGARKTYLSLYKCKHGNEKALLLAKKWVDHFKDDELIEEIYYDELAKIYDRKSQEKLIKKRIKRNRNDIWAWHELGFLTITKADLKTGKEMQKRLKPMEKIFEKLEIIAPNHPATNALKGDYHGLLKDYNKALMHHFKALDDDPEYGYCYSQIWNFSEPFSINDQKKIVKKLEEKIFKTIGFLHNARSLIFNIAGRFGAKQADQIIENWRKKNPEDPEIIEARVDLLLNYGQGTRDAKKAVNLLEKAVKKFPGHLDLRLSLANAYSILLDEEKEIKTLNEILRRDPVNSNSRYRLARILNNRGEKNKAARLLKEGILKTPIDENGWINLSDLYWNNNDIKNSLETLEKGLHINKKNIALRRIFSQRLEESGDFKKSVETAKEGTNIYPGGSYLWLIYGEALLRSDEHGDINEITDVFLKALELNNKLFEAADNLAIIYTDQSEFEKAKEILNKQVLLLDDPSPALGRLAWVKRYEGNFNEALIDLVDVVKKYPTYSWGWQLLILWLNQDKEYELAKKLLKNPHPVMSDDPSFQTDCLILLKKAGVPFDELIKKWEELIKNFPMSINIHTLLFDQLIEIGEIDKAQEINRRIEVSFPDSPEIMENNIEIYIEKNEFQDALNTAVTLFNKDGNHSNSIDLRILEKLKKAGYSKELCEKLFELAIKGEMIRIKPYEFMVENLGIHDSGSKTFQNENHRYLINSRTKNHLLELLKIAGESSFENGEYRAFILERLIDTGNTHDAIKYFYKNTDECMSNKHIWQTLGRIHISDKPKHKKIVREIMAPWRKQHGAEMWAIVNYILALRKTGGLFSLNEDIDEIFETSKDLLLNIKHDHTTKFVVCTFCEAALKKNMDNAFLSAFARFEHVLKDNDSGYWMRDDYEWAPEIFSVFNALITEADEKAVLNLTTKMMDVKRKYHNHNIEPWIKDEWLKRALPKLGLLNKIKIRFMAA